MGDVGGEMLDCWGRWGDLMGNGEASVVGHMI